jgi:hypothetical protein
MCIIATLSIAGPKGTGYLKTMGLAWFAGIGMYAGEFITSRLSSIPRCHPIGEQDTCLNHEGPSERIVVEARDHGFKPSTLISSRIAPMQAVMDPPTMSTRAMSIIRVAFMESSLYASHSRRVACSLVGFRTSVTPPLEGHIVDTSVVTIVTNPRVHRTPDPFCNSS